MRPVRLLSKWVTAEAGITFEDGNAIFYLMGTEVHVPAQGTWPSPVTFPGEILFKLKEYPFVTSTLELSYENGKLQVGNWTIQARAHRRHVRLIRLPIRAKLADIARAMLLNSPEEIDANGLTPIVDDARERVASRIERASRALEALDVTTDDVWALVRHCLLRDLKMPS
jgi:hypothetical protein